MADLSEQANEISRRARAAEKMMSRSMIASADSPFIREAQENQAAFHAANRLVLASTVGEFCTRLAERIKAFETQISESEEIGFQLVSFGKTVVIHVREILYHNPSMIIFTGQTDDGHAAELVQHLSQISFLLMAVTKLEPEQPRRKIGFVAM